MIKCRCGQQTERGKFFCSRDCHKDYLSHTFKQNRERKEWVKKNGPLSDFKKKR